MQKSIHDTVRHENMKHVLCTETDHKDFKKCGKVQTFWNDINKSQLH